METLQQLSKQRTILNWLDEDHIVCPHVEQDVPLLQAIFDELQLQKIPISFKPNSGNYISDQFKFRLSLPTIGRYAVGPSGSWNHRDLKESSEAKKRYPTRREIAYHFKNYEVALVFTPTMKSASLISFDKSANPEYIQIISTFPDAIHKDGWSKSAKEIVNRIRQYVEYNTIVEKINS